MLESIVAYFLLILSVWVVENSLGQATRFISFLLLLASLIIAFVIGEFNEITKHEYIVISLLSLIFYVNHLRKKLDIKQAIPMAFSPLMFVFDQKTEDLLVLKMLIITVFYLFSLSQLKVNVLSNVVTLILVFISFNAVNAIGSVEFIIITLFFGLSINVMSLSKRYIFDEVAYNYLLIFLYLKLLIPQLQKYDAEQIWIITIIYTVLMIILTLIHSVQAKFEKQQLLGFSIALHYVLYTVLGVAVDGLNIPIIVFLIYLVLQLIKNLNQYSKLIYILFLFIFVAFEVLVLNFNLPFLVLSIFYKVLFLFILESKNDHILKGKIAII